MNNEKFIIHNKTKHYTDYEIFKWITECIGKGLLSNNNTEYCYCCVRKYENWELVFVSNKTKTGYRFDIYENPKKILGKEAKIIWLGEDK